MQRPMKLSLENPEPHLFQDSGFRARLEDLVNRSIFAQGFDMALHNGAGTLRNNFFELAPESGKRLLE
jgi:hypothetical protein